LKQIFQINDADVYEISLCGSGYTKGAIATIVNLSRIFKGQ